MILTLYGRPDCHLCEAFEAELAAEFPDLGVRWQDVDATADLAARLGHKVPVLCDGEHEICCHYLDTEALRRYLRAAR